MPHRTLVIPMYQESTRIGGSLATLAGAWDQLGDCELLLVDDGSSDGTAAIAGRVLAELGLPGRVLRLDRNSGKGAAVSAGVEAATGRVIAFSDADLSAPPEAIVRVFEAVEEGIADVVVTTRKHHESSVGTRQPLTRRSTSAAFRRLTQWVGVDGLTDTQCGLKGFTDDAARLLFRDLTVQRFAFDVEVLLRADLARLKVEELPIEWHHVDDSTLRPVRDGARMVLDVVRLRARLQQWRPSGSPVALTEVLEAEHWFYVATRRAAAAAGRRAHVGGPALDVNAGTGAQARYLSLLGHRPVVGIDGARHRIDRSATGDHLSAAGGPERLPFRDGTFGLVTALDVLARLDDDVAGLAEMARVTRPGGHVVVTVPSDPGAWTRYDVVFGHRRRYDARLLRSRLAEAGLEPVDVRPFLGWLTPVSLVLQRTPLRSVLLRDPERATFVRPRINKALRGIDKLEGIVTSGRGLPGGRSLVAVGRVRG